MEYIELAKEFLESLRIIQRSRPYKGLIESMQGEILILNLIFHQTNETVPGDISAETGVSTARVATVLNSLEKKGLLTREIDAEDRRRILIKLTDKGRAVAKSQKEFVENNTSKMLFMLGEKDANEYVRITNKLAKLINEAKK